MTREEIQKNWFKIQEYILNERINLTECSKELIEFLKNFDCSNWGVLKAFKDGKDIEFKTSDNRWVLIDDPSFTSGYEYRIKKSLRNVKFKVKGDFKKLQEKLFEKDEELCWLASGRQIISLSGKYIFINNEGRMTINNIKNSFTYSSKKEIDIEDIFPDLCKLKPFDFSDAEDIIGKKVRHKKLDIISIITNIIGTGVYFAGDENYTKFNDLKDNYEFLNGEPCGKH